MEEGKKTRRDHVYRYLKEKILNNEYLPGEKLIETRIADELHVSRTPVREALMMLEKEQLVHTSMGKSYQVSKISIKLSKDLYYVRELLEPRVVGEIAKKGITKDTIEIRDIVKSLVKARNDGNKEEQIRLIVRLNEALITGHSNEFLEEILWVINRRLYRLANIILQDDKNLESVYSKILKMYESIEKRDQKTAEYMSKEYIRQLYPLLELKKDDKIFDD